MNENKDSTHSFQLSEREENPTHTCTQDTPKKYSHWYGRNPWLAFIIGPPLLFFVLAVINCFAFYLFLSFTAEGRTVETSPLIMQTVFWASRTIAFVPALGAALLLCWMVNRSGRRRLWALAACGIVALLGKLFFRILHIAPDRTKNREAYGLFRREPTFLAK